MNKQSRVDPHSRRRHSFGETALYVPTTVFTVRIDGKNKNLGVPKASYLINVWFLIGLK